MQHTAISLQSNWLLHCITLRWRWNRWLFLFFFFNNLNCICNKTVWGRSALIKGNVVHLLTRITVSGQSESFLSCLVLKPCRHWEAAEWMITNCSLSLLSADFLFYLDQVMFCCVCYRQSLWYCWSRLKELVRNRSSAGYSHNRWMSSSR